MILRGRVVDFSEQEGLGVVEESMSDPRQYPFHCIDIADGSRTIELGRAVLFELHPGNGGTLQACDIHKLERP